MSLTTGDRAQLYEALGTIEKLREDGMTAEVLWDTGARCPLPLDWLSDPEAREAERKARQAEARRERRPARVPRRCEGCAKVFTPRDKRQRFHTSRCRRQARLRVDKQKQVQGIGADKLGAQLGTNLTPLGWTTARIGTALGVVGPSPRFAARLATAGRPARRPPIGNERERHDRPSSPSRSGRS
jgi:hypothetical protein